MNIKYRRIRCTLPLMLFLATPLELAQASQASRADRPPVVRNGEPRGGGGLITLDRTALERRIEGGILQSATKNYFVTLEVNGIQEPEVKSLLIKYGKDSILKALAAARFRAAKPGESCRDRYSQDVDASATIGKPGGVICFDTDRILKYFEAQYRTSQSQIEEEIVLIKLGSLASHEVLHHLQRNHENIDANARNEREAYVVGAYVQNTARWGTQPTLKWAPEGTPDAPDLSVFDNALFFRKDADDECGMHSEIDASLRVVYGQVAQNPYSSGSCKDRFPDAFGRSFKLHCEKQNQATVCKLERILSNCLRFEKFTVIPDGNLFYQLGDNCGGVETVYKAVKYFRAP
jgi:hypothetical protein